MDKPVTAYAYSQCAISKARIRPGDDIVPMGNGRWALAWAAKEHERQRIADGQFREQLRAFIASLPQAV